MSKKYTFEEVKNLIESQSKCELLDTEYFNCKKSLNLKCECGNTFLVNLDTFKNKDKKQCNDCSRQLIRTDIVEIEEFILESCPNYKLLDTEYRETSKGRKLLYVHVNCGKYNHDSYWNSWERFKKGQRCSKCYHESKTNKPDKWNEENIRKLLAENNLQIANEHYEFNNAKKKIKCLNTEGFFVDVLINSLQGDTPPSIFKRNKYAIENLTILCKKYNLTLLPGQKWEGAKHKYKAINLEGYKVEVYSDTLLKGKLPRIFHPTNPYTIGNIQQYCNLNNLEYEIVSKHYNNYKELLIFKYIGNTVEMEENQRYFSVSLDKFIHQDVRHPKLSQSKGEQEIEYWLTRNDIKYIRQYKFDDCRNKNKLPFDFGIINERGQLELLIEYDGIQHYYPFEYFGGDEGFNLRKKHDQIKDDYCKINRVPLLRIPYWEKSNVNMILANRITEERKREQHKRYLVQ